MNETTNVRPDLHGMPVILLFGDRKLVVVGAGNIATTKIESLIESGAKNITVISPLASPEVYEWEKQGLLKLSIREFRENDLDDAFFVTTATDESEVNHQVFKICEANNILCNSADDPANCSVIKMAKVVQGDITVAVSTAGRSPAIGKWLISLIKKELVPEFKDLMNIFSEERELMRSEGFSSEDVNWNEIFSKGVIELAKDGKFDEIREIVQSEIALVKNSTKGS